MRKDPDWVTVKELEEAKKRYMKVMKELMKEKFEELDRELQKDLDNILKETIRNKLAVSLGTTWDLMTEKQREMAVDHSFYVSAEPVIKARKNKKEKK